MSDTYHQSVPGGVAGWVPLMRAIVAVAFVAGVVSVGLLDSGPGRFADVQMLSRVGWGAAVFGITAGAALVWSWRWRESRALASVFAAALSVLATGIAMPHEGTAVAWMVPMSVLGVCAVMGDVRAMGTAWGVLVAGACVVRGMEGNGDWGAVGLFAAWSSVVAGSVAYGVEAAAGAARLSAGSHEQMRVQALESTEQAVQERTRMLMETQREITSERALLSTIINNIPFYVFWMDRDLKYAGCNTAFAGLTGKQVGEVVGKTDFDLPWSQGEGGSSTGEYDPMRLDPVALANGLDDAEVMMTGTPRLHVEQNLTLRDGTPHTMLASKVPLRTDEGEIVGVMGIYLDITERKQLESQLSQAQKLESIGQLAAGIAHEINTPVQYVSDNLRFLKEQFGGLMGVVDRYAALLGPESSAMSWDERRAAMEATLEQLDFAFLRSEVPQALDQSLDGLGRVATIIRAMKEFSHPGSTHKESADLNKAISSTAAVCTNRWRYVADLKLELEADLPAVPCLVAEFNQVMLNLIVNAADAIAERREKMGASTPKGWIRVSTARVGDSVEIRVADNGGGIPESVKSKIFSPFFTTKPVGKGTGQGLAISRNVIVTKHGGTLTFETVAGEGTTFAITLPLKAVEANGVQGQGRSGVVGVAVGRAAA